MGQINPHGLLYLASQVAQWNSAPGSAPQSIPQKTPSLATENPEGADPKFINPNQITHSERSGLPPELEAWIRAMSPGMAYPWAARERMNQANDQWDENAARATANAAQQDFFDPLLRPYDNPAYTYTGAGGS